MSEIQKTRCGMVSIVGRPNSGKSTLLNKIIGEKIAIVSRVPQTTRQQIRGIYSDERGQIIFIDTPGLHLGADKLDQAMKNSVVGSMQEADCLIYLVDTTRHIGQEQHNMSQQVASFNIPLVLGLNKVDIKKADIPAYIDHWQQVKGEPVTELEKFAMVALSGEKGINIEKLVDVIFEFLPEGPILYPTDVISDTPQKMVIADVVREKLFENLIQELPHSVGVFIEDMRPVKGNTMKIKVLIYVERATQKEIVIGKNGQILKKVGTAARLDLEDLLESRVFIEFHVKILKNWRDNVSILQELGYVQ